MLLRCERREPPMSQLGPQAAMLGSPIQWFQLWLN
jgi:hypothetical protein